jgi:SEC-C motif-containing protein
MRSRYTAFARGASDYLLATWHQETRPPNVSQPAGLQWLELKVKGVREIDATRAKVEFIARYSLNGRVSQLHERSRFLHEESRWYYLDGEVR